MNALTQKQQRIAERLDNGLSLSMAAADLGITERAARGRFQRVQRKVAAGKYSPPLLPIEEACKAPALEARHLQILQHAIGADNHGRFGPSGSYRNHFVTSEGGMDVVRCRDLVAHGLMAEHPPRFSSSPWFSVTEAGREYVATQSTPPPKVSRSKARYQRYLDSDGAFASFRDFLKHEEQERKACKQKQ